MRSDDTFLRHLLATYPFTVAYAVLAVWTTVVILIVEG